MIGILNYSEFASNFKLVKQSNIFAKLNNLLPQVFEGVFFAELHWKIDVMHQVERLVTKLLPDTHDMDREGINEPFLRNFFFLKCASTVDEFLMSMLYA